MGAVVMLGTLFGLIVQKHVSLQSGRTATLSIAAAIVIGHAVYGSVFAPHLATKLSGLVTAGPTQQLFAGVPTQPE